MLFALYARARQTFRVTPEGRRLLEGLRREVAELYEEVVLGREPGHEHLEPKRAVHGPTSPQTRTTRRKKTKRSRS